MKASYDLSRTSARKIGSSHRAAKQCISAEKHTLFFDIIAATSFGMSRCVEHLDGKSGRFEDLPVIQKDIRLN